MASLDWCDWPLRLRLSPRLMAWTCGRCSGRGRARARCCRLLAVPSSESLPLAEELTRDCVPAGDGSPDDSCGCESEQSGEWRSGNMRCLGMVLVYDDV